MTYQWKPFERTSWFLTEQAQLQSVLGLAMTERSDTINSARENKIDSSLGVSGCHVLWVVSLTVDTSAILKFYQKL